MSTAKLTLMGLYQYDNTIFDFLTLPAGIDKTLLIDNILIRSADFEVLYPDPNFIKPAIGVWGQKWHRTFEKWQKALAVEYDPLYNYDRREEWITNEDIADAGTHKESNLSAGSDRSETQTGSTSTDKVSAYNNNTLVNDKQNELSSDGNTSSVTTMNTDRSGSDTNSRDRNEVRTGRAYGNIGVTTSQQMLQSELDIASWNLYEHITDIFLSEFIIPVF